jgi:predicted MPP superfamily phosphohydrolase
MHARRIQRLLVLLALVISVVSAAAIDLTLPNQKDSLKFAVIGDSGTGSKSQQQIAQQLIDSRGKFQYDFVVMMGDNLYGGSGQKDFARKFEEPYKPLIDAGIKFYATLGNHDNPNERFYERWNMKGERYYTFRPKLGVRFFVLDSNYMDPKQLEWIGKELAASGSDWKICYFHHPL